jgi:hypothetical protein
MEEDNAWTITEAVPEASADSREPSLAFVGEMLHLAWSRNRMLVHSIYDGSGWGVPIRIASGQQPHLAATPDGRLHCLFAHRFIGNYEIYYTCLINGSWALPEPVSRTPGASTDPALAVGPDGTLHAAWADTTPGYATVYYGTYRPPFWTSIPIPSGRGVLPTIAVAADGEVHVAWQDRVEAAGRYEILTSRLRDGQWSVPQLVSNSPNAHSLRPQLMADSRGACYMVWQEENGNIYHVRYAERGEQFWRAPADLSLNSDDCRYPFLAQNRQRYVQALWLEGRSLRHRVRPPETQADWWPPEELTSDQGGLSELTVAIGPTGEAHVAISRFNDSGAHQIYFTHRRAVVKPVVIT